MAEQTKELTEFGMLGTPSWGTLWQNTLGYAGVQPKVGFLTEEQNCRLERIRVARMLWKGWHRRAYLWEGRTQFNYPPMRVQGRLFIPYITFNILRLVTTTITDLVLGEEPLLKADDEKTETALNDLVKRSDLARVFADATREASWAAEATVQITRWGNDAYVVNVPPAEVFPIGTRSPDGQYQQYKRFALNQSNEAKPRQLLLETTFTPGEIRRQCSFLDKGGITGNATMALWPEKLPDGKDLPDVEGTGLDVPSIIWMPNELDEGQPTSDYDGLIELQDELNSKQTQIARVIAQHADPKMVMPQSMADGQGNVHSAYGVFFARTKDEAPSYITWNAELASAIEDRDFTLNAICMAAEVSPVLLGIKTGATAADTASKLKLEATKSLARAARKGKFVRPFINTAIDTALAMQSKSTYVAVSMAGTSVQLRDGLPVDELQQASTLSMLTGGKQVMSVDRAVHTLIADADAAEQELEKLKEEQAAATPSIFFSGNNGQEPGEGAPPAANESQANQQEAA